MIRILLLLSFVCFALTALSQDVFQRSYGGPGSEYGRAVIECSTGGYAIVGSTNSYYNPSTDVYLLRVDEMGEYMWGKNIGAPNKIDWGIDLAEDESGNFIIAGYSNNSPTGSYDGLLIKTNPIGEVIWQKTFGGDDWDFIEGMAVNSDGEIILAGQKTEDGLQKGWILKTDSDGEVIWETLLESSGQLKLTGIDVCVNQAIVFTGYTSNLVLETKTFVAGRLNQSGEIVWVSNYTEFYKAESGKCACDILTNTFVGIGTVFHPDDHSKFFYFKINSISGSIEWKIQIDSDNAALGTGIAVRPDGKILLAASVYEAGWLDFDSGSYVVSSGGPLISSQYAESLGGYGVDKVYDIFPTSDGGYVTTGETNSFGNNYQVHFCKIDSMGTRDETNIDFLDLATTIPQESTKANFEIFPNPAQNELNVNFNFYKNAGYTISTPTGKEIENGLFENRGENSIDISNLKAGLYIISLYEKDELIGLKRFIKLP